MRLRLVVWLVVLSVACKNPRERRSPETTEVEEDAKSSEKAPAAPKRREPAACGYLADNEAFRTSAWSDEGLGYGCNSGYWRLGGSPLENNLAYYVTGDEKRATKLMLQLNVNDRGEAETAHKALAETADKLSTKAGLALPDAVRKSIVAGKTATSGRFTVTRDDWPTGKGYGLALSIKVD